MNYVMAKIKGRGCNFEKLYAGEAIFSLPREMENAVDYDPLTILENGEWYKIEKFSDTEFIIDFLKQPFNSTDYCLGKNIQTEKIDYIVSYQDDVYCFQRVMKSSIMSEKRILFGDSISFHKEEKSIVINEFPDAIYEKNKDVLFFKKLESIARIFKGIDILYREATESETIEFLKNDFIETSEEYGVEKIGKRNLQRIAMAMETLKEFDTKGKRKMLDYTHKYYPALQFDEKEKKFTISNDEEMKYLLWGIEQRYYTTPVTKEKRIANSIVKISGDK